MTRFTIFQGIFVLLLFTGCKKEVETTSSIIITHEVSEIGLNNALSGGSIVGDGGAPILVKGICWGESPDPSLPDSEVRIAGEGRDSFTLQMSALKPETQYYVRAFSINEKGTSYGNEQVFTTLYIYPQETQHCDEQNPTKIVEVFNPTTGKIWMDRNLGASRVAQSIDDRQAYGDLYQWGRFGDGHQCRDSELSLVQSSSDRPEHSDFIVVSAVIQPMDWRDSPNDDLWSGAKSLNNPCPAGYRLPTEAEISEELQTWDTQDLAGAFGSILKLPAAGRRDALTGVLLNESTSGAIWASSVNGVFGRRLYFGNNLADTGDRNRAQGSSVRCIKD